MNNQSRSYGCLLFSNDCLGKASDFQFVLTTHWGAYAKTTATAAKTSLENKHLGNGDYFQIIASSSHPTLFIEHAANGQVEAPLKLILRMKDLLLRVHIVV